MRIRRLLGLALGMMLGAAPSVFASSITLRWTAPGDDSLKGRATAYDLRFNTRNIIPASFMAATKAVTKVPAVPGAPETCVVSGLQPNTTYYFALKTVDEVGNWSLLSNVITRTTPGPVGVGEVPRGALQFSAPRPNPARASTAFALTLPVAAEVRVVAYDLQGRVVRTLLEGWREAGEIRVAWDLTGERGPVSSGVYLVRAVVLGEVIDRRVAVLR